jgi:hypothetical protein
MLPKWQSNSSNAISPTQNLKIYGLFLFIQCVLLVNFVVRVAIPVTVRGPLLNMMPLPRVLLTWMKSRELCLFYPVLLLTNLFSRVFDNHYRHSEGSCSSACWRIPAWGGRRAERTSRIQAFKKTKKIGSEAFYKEGVCVETNVSGSPLEVSCNSERNTEH